jgi:hypothetical protein
MNIKEMTAEIKRIRARTADIETVSDRASANFRRAWTQYAGAYLALNPDETTIPAFEAGTEMITMQRVTPHKAPRGDANWTTREIFAGNAPFPAAVYEDFRAVMRVIPNLHVPVVEANRHLVRPSELAAHVNRELGVYLLPPGRLNNAARALDVVAADLWREFFTRRVEAELEAARAHLRTARYNAGLGDRDEDESIFAEDAEEDADLFASDEDDDL